MRLEHLHALFSQEMANPLRLLNGAWYGVVDYEANGCQFRVLDFGFWIFYQVRM
jgi:hypothetical protein